jgi:hypothetical protein
MMTAIQAAAFAADATRQVLTLATGVLAVTVTFMSDLVPNPSIATITLMAVGWLFLLVGIVAGIVCLFALASEVARAENRAVDPLVPRTGGPRRARRLTAAAGGVSEDLGAGSCLGDWREPW